MEKKGLIKKIIFISIIIILIVLAFFIVIQYNVEGEKEIPFKVSKILITSNIDAYDVEQTESLWDINVSLPNDIFIYFEKNNEDEIGISNIRLDNFSVNKNPNIGEIQVLRPTDELQTLFKYSEQNYLDSFIEYTGGEIDDLKSLQISNSGGVIVFRVENKNIGEYISNEDTEIVYDGTLLAKLGLSIENVKYSISFDLTIKTTDNISYKTTVTIDLPVGNIIEEGKSSIEIYNLDNLIFKRV